MSCPCKYCGEPTAAIVDQVCESCRPTELYVKANPKLARKILASLRPSAYGLDPDTKVLVHDFAVELENKLLIAQVTHGWTNNWKRGGWMDECRAKLAANPDPLDVAAYCAFLWYHGEKVK